MTKKFLTFVVPFIVSTIAYIVWIFFRREREEAAAQGQRLPPWQDYPRTWLVTLGASLAAVTIAFSALSTAPGPIPNAARRAMRTGN